MPATACDVERLVPERKSAEPALTVPAGGAVAEIAARVHRPSTHGRRPWGRARGM